VIVAASANLSRVLVNYGEPSDNVNATHCV
jgi:hypothetical protein